jgi:S1-C subfamily serine protease
MSNPLEGFSEALSALAASAAASVVAVRSHRSRSSGFLWRPGLIVTADEALAEEGEVAVALPGGQMAEAKVAGRDPTTDIALLRIEAKTLKPAALTSPPVSIGALAVVVGSEDGDATAAVGTISRAAGPWQSLRGGEIDARLELAVPLGRRGEGGLVLDVAGHALGMAVFGPRRRILVIPAATIERVAARLEAHGRIARGYLGLGLRPVTIEGSDDTGAMVINVDPDGPGRNAGIHQGDVIIAWGGAPVRHFHSLLRALGPQSVGRTVTIGLRRGGQTQEITLTIGERAAA